MTTATRTRKTTKTRKPVSEAEKQRRVDARKAKTEELHAGLEGQVSALAGSDEWAAYLKFAKSLHRYSFTNMMLIMWQCPTATNVAGYGQWQEKGRQVRKGAKSIAIYGYATKRITEKDEETGAKTEKRIAFYPIRYVFDVADTEPITEDMLEGIKAKNPKAKVWTETPDPVRLLEGEDEHGIAARVETMVTGLGWSLEYVPRDGSSNGRTMLDGSKRVEVVEDMSPAARAKTALHECGHMLLHADVETGQRAADGPESRNVQELEAESVAYVVAGALGLDTSTYSIGYLASWSKDDSKAVAATAERVLGAAQRILSTAFPLIEDEDDAE
jgi:hypothetical protein